MRKVLLFTAVFSLIGAISLISCKNEKFDTETNEICPEVFLQTFETKLNLVFQTAEVGLQNDNQQGFEHLFRGAYTEVLGNYAFTDAFDNGLLEVSLESRAVRTRSMEEADSEALLLQVINASETIEEAIERFDALINDVSFCVEDRMNFVSMRELLTFFKRNESEITAQVESSDNYIKTRTQNNREVELEEDASEITADGGGNWRCVAGVAGAYLTGGVQGCGIGGGVGAAVGLFGGLKGSAIGALVGCAVGWTAGALGGALSGFAEHC